MSLRRHDEVAHAYWIDLRRRGIRAAWECGIPGGRIDIVRLDERDRWLELYEVKVRDPHAGITQLQRYAEIVGGHPALRLVVPPDIATPTLSRDAAGEGVTLEVFTGAQLLLFGAAESLADCPNIPWLHPESIARIKNGARKAA